MRPTLILVDIQNDYFKGGAFPLPGMERAARVAAMLLKRARKEKWKIIHVQHLEADKESGFLVKGTRGAAIHRSVHPKRGEKVVKKAHPNAFKDTSLYADLLNAQRIYFAGAMSNMCIDATARTASDLGFEVSIVEDACAASSLRFDGKRISAKVVHGAFMAALASAYGTVIPASAV